MSQRRSSASWRSPLVRAFWNSHMPGTTQPRPDHNSKQMNIFKHLASHPYFQQVLDNDPEGRTLMQLADLVQYDTTTLEALQDRDDAFAYLRERADWDRLLPQSICHAHWSASLNAMLYSPINWLTGFHSPRCNQTTFFHLVGKHQP